MFKCFSRHDTARNAKSSRRWNCGKQTVIRPGWPTSGSVSTSSGRRRLTVPPRRRAAWVGWPSLTSPCRLPCRGWSLAEERDDERLLVVRTSVTDQSDLCWIESNLYNDQFESSSTGITADDRKTRIAKNSKGKPSLKTSQLSKNKICPSRLFKA